MRKTLLLITLFCVGFYASAQTPVKITFEDAEIGSTGGVIAMWGGGTAVVAANTYTTGNSSAKALHVNNTNYLPLYFENVTIPAGAESLYSILKVKYLMIGGTDMNYPTLEIFSSPNSSTASATEKIADHGWANLWGTAEIGVWKTVEFAFSTSLLKPVPGGKLILKLSKSSCEYLVDDVELVPIPAASTIFTLADFEANSINDVLNMRRWTPTDASATVVANPTVANEKSVQILATNWNSALKMNVALPAGKTIADYQKLTFDIYLNNIEGADNGWKNIEVYLDGTKKIDIQSPGVANAWESKSYDLVDFTSANSLVMDIGLNTNKGNYYLDNIKITQKTTGFDSPDSNPLIVYATSSTFILNQKVDFYELYNVHGIRMVSGQNTAEINITNLNTGIYILKASIGNSKYVTKLIK